MTVLQEKGVGGVRIEHIAARLELTKGSFHHHFTGIGDYRRALLQRYEETAAATIEHAKTAIRDLAPQQALTELPTLVPVDPRLEAAIRGWAFQDDDAHDALGRIDQARLRALTELWQALIGDSRRAHAAALIPHLVMIGASVAVPTPTRNDVADVFDLLADLVPSVGE